MASVKRIRKAKPAKKRGKAAKAKAKRGRPTKYTAKLAEEILRRMAVGEGVKTICRDDHMPSEGTVRGWNTSDREGFSAPYTRAREGGCDAIADEILEIADDSTNDFMERKRADGSIEVILNSEHVQRSRLRIDSRKWLVSKLAPKQFGDKLEVTGKDGGPVIPVINVTIGGAQPQPAPETGNGSTDGGD